jgi:hypothetical protein
VAAPVKSLDDGRKFQGISHPKVKQSLAPPALNGAASPALHLYTFADGACSEP